MKRQPWIALLVCLNVILATGIVLSSYSPPAAYAQGAGLSGNYMLVAGEIQNKYDALYIIDLRVRAIHAFFYDKTTKKLTFSGSRDLERDFRHNRG